MGSTNSGLNYVEAPAWMLQEDGRLATFLPHADTSKGQIHLYVPSGIGDVAWIWARYWYLSEVMGKDVTWHFPDDAIKRVAPYAELVGLKFAPHCAPDYAGGKYMFDPIDIRRLLEFPGELQPEDVEDGGQFYVHANIHLETGQPLHSGVPRWQSGNQREWHPWLPYRNPCPPLSIIHDGERPPQTSENEGIWQYADRSRAKPYVALHMASETYCEGNYFPKIWAKAIEWIERNVAPVRLIGAKWDEGMIQNVSKFYTPRQPVATGQTLATVLSIIANAKAVIGVDSGLTIMATYMGVPALRAYPRWLHLMPGNWESDAHPHTTWCFMDDLMDLYQDWLYAL